jgi:phospholipid transport system substrate-binding protein
LIAVNILENNMYKIISTVVIALMSAFAVPLAHAEDVAPDMLLKGVTDEVIAIIRQDKEIQAGNPAKVANLVETKILPLFDFTRMTQLAVARNWRLATPEQQKTLTTEFKTLLVRTYSTALSSYGDQNIEFKRLRTTAGDTEVTVRSVVKQPGAESLSMDYDMEKVASGWKVYDIKVGGVSLITTYRETFASRVHESGMDGLIKSLADKNRQGDSHRSQPTGSLYFQIFARSILQSGG